jgi:hypothetical protein
MIKNTFILLVLYALTSTVAAMSLPDEILQSLESADARGIAKHFDLSVKLILDDTEGVYSKSQAEQILRTFFNNHTTTDGRFKYSHLHGSDRDNMQYFIGELTGKGKYRITVDMKNKQIFRIRIENNE